MKEKIKEALKTRAKNLGLDDSAFDGVAAFGETIVKEEADIDGFVNSDATMNLLKTYQSVADKARAAARAKNEPEPKPTDTGNQPNPAPEPPKPETNTADMAKIIAEAVATAIKPISDELAGFKAEQSAKSALANAEATFKGNDYVKKYVDEAADAWERATEMYEATGKSWTAEQLGEKAMGYFNKAVAKKGVDTTKPFESGGGAKTMPDFSEDVELLKSEGVEFAEDSGK